MVVKNKLSKLAYTTAYGRVDLYVETSRLKQEITEANRLK